MKKILMSALLVMLAGSVVMAKSSAKQFNASMPRNSSNTPIMDMDSNEELSINVNTTFDNGLTLSGNLTFNEFILPGEATATYDAASDSMTAITPTTLMTLVDSTGTITLGATPTIDLSTNTYDGYLFQIQCSSHNVVLQDNNSLSGSLLELTDSDTSITLTKGDIITFKVDRGSYRQQGQVVRDSGNITTKGTLSAEQVTSTDDATITDDLSVGGDATITGTTVTSTTTVSGMYGLQLLTDGDTTSAPSAIGILMIDTANDCELYISTGTGAGEWEKVGAQ